MCKVPKVRKCDSLRKCYAGRGDGEKSKAQIITHLYVPLRSECSIYSKYSRELWKYSEQRRDIDILVF